MVFGMLCSSRKPLKLTKAYKTSKIKKIMDNTCFCKLQPIGIILGPIALYEVLKLPHQDYD